MEIAGGSLACLLFVTIIISVVVYRNWKYEQELSSLLWKIDYKDLKVQDCMSLYSSNPHNAHLGIQNMSMAKIPNGFRLSVGSLNSMADFEQRQVFTQTGHYKGQLVAIKMLNKRNVEMSRSVKKELKQIREIRNDHLNTFLGACVDSNKVCIITEYCSKGSLQDILANDDLRLDSMFIASLVFDIIKGMTFLHDSEIRSHGRLKSANCVVDSKWVLKITDYGLWEFKRDPSIGRDMTESQYYESLLWTAPELLRATDPPKCGSQKGDIYSFAIILYEIHGRNGPYGDIDISHKEIISNVKMDGDIPYRPRLSQLSSTIKAVTDCIKACWNEDPIQRPDFKLVRRLLKPMQKGMKPNIFDQMMAMMEKYASNLEEIVDERTDMLRDEKKRTEELLHQMLPRSVTEQLKQGKQVEAEAFDSVTIYFSDICGFTALSSESTPMQIVDLLNDLYTIFDSIIAYYDVYKVETIGDAYMVVSGLPNRNGIKHAGEIASMSLHLLDVIDHFKLRHRPNYKLKLRIGIHSGPCVAGVVGSIMPRYCLFGDTVNTSSRMESHGVPLKIHCSTDCKELLEKIGGYHIEYRGPVSMKGKGEVHTYFVTGEDHSRRSSIVHVIEPTHSNACWNCENSPFCNKMKSVYSSPLLNNRHNKGSINALSIIPDNSPEEKRTNLETDMLKCSHEKEKNDSGFINDKVPFLSNRSSNTLEGLLSTGDKYLGNDVNINRIRSQGQLFCDSAGKAFDSSSVESISKFLNPKPKRASSVKIRFNDDYLSEAYKTRAAKSPSKNYHQKSHYNKSDGNMNKSAHSKGVISSNTLGGLESNIIACNSAQDISKSSETTTLLCKQNSRLDPLGSNV